MPLRHPAKPGGRHLITELAEKLVRKDEKLSTAESCTGGGIAARCTDEAGSSEWFSGGVVTYSNEMKIQLGVLSESILSHGAVSEVVVRAMAEKGLIYCKSDWSVAVSGVAGPGGGTVDKPVGMVCFAWANQKTTVSETAIFKGDRAQIRLQTVNYALNKLNDLLK